MVSALFGLVGTGVASWAWAQAQQRQQVRLTGQIYDETRRPVAMVEVIVNRREVRTRSDPTGLFSLDVGPGDSTLGFRRIGYRPVLLTIRPLPPPGDTILVQLVTSPVELPEVIISGSPSKPLRYAGTTKYDDVFFRRKIGLGTLIDRDAIEAHFGAATYQLMQGLPGVRVLNGPPKRIRFARCNAVPGAVQVYIDGVRQIASASSIEAFKDVEDRIPTGFRPPAKKNPPLDEEPEVEMLSRINPSDIEMIEVFRGPSELPGVFHSDGCAVIAIWTKWNK